MPKRKSGLSASKTHAILRKLEARISDVVATVVFNKHTHQELIDAYHDRVSKSSEFKRPPNGLNTISPASTTVRVR